ncbi:MAG: TolC family protein [Cyclobacteriaceae bacterium]|nr:TolC family protein [Cyclobacteriaceae bacterium]
MKHNVMICLALMFLFSGSGMHILFAQESWNLKQCLLEASSNNLDIRESLVQYEAEKIKFSTTRYSYLPDLSANLRTTNNWGLFIDPTTNILTNAYNVNAHSFLYSSIDVYRGFNYRHRLSLGMNRLEFTEAVQREEFNRMYLEVVSHYTSAMLAKEQIENARERLKQLDKQKLQTQRMVELGILHPRDFYNIEYFVAAEDQNLVIQENRFESSLLLLAQSMGISPKRVRDIVHYDLDESLAGIIISGKDDVYKIIEEAFEILPEGKLAKLNIEAAEINMKLQRSFTMPVVSLDGFVGTRLSTINPLPSTEQLNNNFYQYLGIGLTVPIFNKFSLQNNVQISELELKSSRIAEEKTRQEIEQNVVMAFLELKGAQKNFEALGRQFKAVDQEFSYAQRQFDIGALNLVEYGEVRNRYVITQSELLQSKYDYFLRWVTSEIYRGQYLENIATP